ncbi:MAG: DUF4327 family protein [Spirirestis rafaelensis WJT71-NPBG6]|jgi:hypothetical protein|nr:DUF4327 family protein [Spirirestis rafaelensis WJT71-NPBG6]
MTHKYDLRVIQDEAYCLVEKGFISRQQSIYILFRYIPMREWLFVERELEEKNFQLGDRICDLIGDEQWLFD